MFAPLFAPDLFHCSSVLLCMYSDEDMPSLCVSQELFDRVLSQPGVQGVGDLVVANVRFTVTGQVSSVKGDSVWADSYLMASGVTDWLEFAMQEAEPVATPIRARARTVVCCQGGELTDFEIVYTRERSVDVLHASGSLLLQIILFCLAVLYSRLDFRLNGKSLCRESSFSGLFRRPVHSVNREWYTVTVYITMAADAPPRGDHSGVRFRDVLQPTWNAPESFVTLTSPEVVTLYTSVIQDVLGLRTCSSNAGRTQVLPGSVRALIPDDRAIPRGFHNVTLVDLSTETSPIVSM